MTHAINCAKVTKAFPGIVAVNNLTLRIPKGQATAILGPNGAGKTTLVEMLEGITEPDSGTIEILGNNWNKDRDILRKKIGLSFQETHFMDRLTVRETAHLFANLYDVSREQADKRLEEVGLVAKANDRVGPLSGGQRQKLALAIALLPTPELLFLDEPTTGLDPSARRELWNIVQKLKSDNTTVILTTHYLEEAEALCQWIVIMDQGRILAQGTSEELIDKYCPGDTLSFQVEQPDRVDLKGVDGIVSQRIDGQRISLNVQRLNKVVPKVLQQLDKLGVEATALNARRSTLEDVFLVLAGHSLMADGTTKPAGKQAKGEVDQGGTI